MTGGEDGAPEKSRQKSHSQENDSPFDIWLKRGLHQLFDDVASEPIPEELLRLIEDDRNDRSS
ncbi:NepR family anti-sigma factor [Asaia sp. BMEF1]|uniref:NepR family anti-sigma factor n=1 Tax=unclassified Asaia TaxID=2685023 RepID=UPI0030184BBC